MTTYEEQHIRKQVALSFSEMESTNDLVRLINKVWSFFSGENYQPIPAKVIYHFSNHQHSQDAYRSFEIPKKNGKMRTIQSPCHALKRIQFCLNFILSSMYDDPHPAAKGFVRGRSILDAARPHVKMPYIYHVDLKDFFPSISFFRIKACLEIPPFNLSGSKKNIAFCIANLCCLYDGEQSRLPQGAPTSPILSNIVCQRLDKKLTGLAKRFNARYTRYADDLTFSSYINLAGEKDFQEELARIIDGQQFCVQEDKTHQENRQYRQRVLGLTVNEKLNISKEYVKSIKMYLYLWESYGYGRACRLFEADWDKSAKNTRSIPSLRNYLSGKLEYMRLVKGSDDPTFQSLYQRFTDVCMENDIPDWKQFKKEMELFCQKAYNPTYDAKELLRWYQERLVDIDVRLLKESNLYFSITKAFTYLSKKLYANQPLMTKVAVHDARRLPFFLYTHFSKQEPLKFLTHTWDQYAESTSFTDYEDFIQKTNEAFKRITPEFKELDRQLYACFYAFLNNDGNGRGWGQYHLKTSWKSDWIKAWCNKHTDSSPWDCPIPEAYKQINDNLRVNYFSDIIELFKEEFQIRTENQQLKRMVRRLVNKHLNPGFNVRINVPPTKLYTNVSLLSHALDTLLYNLSQRKEFTDIEITTIDQPDYIDLSVCQIGSIYYADREQLLQETESGDFEEIRKKLTNRCDWMVQTTCKDGGNYQIAYLNSLAPNGSTKELDKVKGFTHILRFYKPQAYEKNTDY